MTRVISSGKVSAVKISPLNVIKTDAHLNVSLQHPHVGDLALEMTQNVILDLDN